MKATAENAPTYCVQEKEVSNNRNFCRFLPTFAEFGDSRIENVDFKTMEYSTKWQNRSNTESK